MYDLSFYNMHTLIATSSTLLTEKKNIYIHINNNINNTMYTSITILLYYITRELYNLVIEL